MRTTFPKAKSARSGWNLYWVTSDGDEDCFVVARNSRSAERIEVDYCGFARGDVRAIRVKSIPAKLLREWGARLAKAQDNQPLPRYADDWLLRRLGAAFRQRDYVSETLIDEVVYTNDPEGPVCPRVIGRRFLTEFQAEKSFKRYGRQDRYSQSQMALFTLLGICISRVQEIEHLIAHSFVLGSVVESDRRKRRTIAELIKSWERKTLGQMLRTIEQNWEIDSTIHASLELFLQMRNQLVHGFTTSDQYDIHTSWGQDETVAFLAFFEILSRPLREAFQASLYASIDMGNSQILSNEPAKHCALTARQKK